MALNHHCHFEWNASPSGLFILIYVIGIDSVLFHRTSLQPTHQRKAIKCIFASFSKCCVVIYYSKMKRNEIKASWGRTQLQLLPKYYLVIHKGSEPHLFRRTVVSEVKKD